MSAHVHTSMSRIVSPGFIYLIFLCLSKNYLIFYRTWMFSHGRMLPLIIVICSWVHNGNVSAFIFVPGESSSSNERRACRKWAFYLWCYIKAKNQIFRELLGCISCWKVIITSPFPVTCHLFFFLYVNSFWRFQWIDPFSLLFRSKRRGKSSIHSMMTYLTHFLGLCDIALLLCTSLFVIHSVKFFFQ